MQRNKFERVQLPRSFGLNAENSVLVRTITELKTHSFIKDRKKFSVRTFYKDDQKKKAPHLCTTTRKNLFRRAPKLFQDGLWLIVADQIDSKDCEFRGTIWIQRSGQTIIEIANGPGTVRTVTNDGIIDERYNLKPGQWIRRLLLNQCIKKCRETNLNSVIFEFSYYTTLIGCKNAHFICWEITDDGSHQCRLFKEQK